MKADLHVHTTASDGQYAPGEVARMAKALGVECLAITDHDTMDGLDEAQSAGEQYGLRVVPGVELGAKEDRHLHILGLAFAPEKESLRALCQKMKDSRDERKYRIIRYLKERGVEISLSEVEETAGGEIIARPHFAQVMLRHGYVSTIREAFDRYLDTTEFQKIERFKAPAADCIRAIHGSGGKAALAHPYQLGFSDQKLEETVRTLKACGLDGLECYYPAHTPQQVAFYLSLAQKYDLHVTAGSDFHGEKVRPGVALRGVELALDWLFQET